MIDGGGASGLAGGGQDDGLDFEFQVYDGGAVQVNGTVSGNQVTGTNDDGMDLSLSMFTSGTDTVLDFNMAWSGNSITGNGGEGFSIVITSSAFDLVGGGGGDFNFGMAFFANSSSGNQRDGIYFATDNNQSYALPESAEAAWWPGPTAATPSRATASPPPKAAPTSNSNWMHTVDRRRSSPAVTSGARRTPEPSTR